MTKKELILNLWTTTYPAEIARQVGCSREYVRQVGQEAGLVTNQQLIRSIENKHKLEQLKAIKQRKLVEREVMFTQLYNEGKSDPQIAGLTGYNPMTVFKWRDKHNLPSNSPKGRRRKCTT